MNKKLVVLTAAFALSAGIVFAQEMKADAPAAAPVAPAAAAQDMNAATANTEHMNAATANTEDMNAATANTEDMNAETTNAEEMNAEGTKEDAPAAAAPAAVPAADSKY